MDKKKLYVSLAILCTLSAMSIPAEAKMTKEAHALYQQACAYEYKSDYNTAIKIIEEIIKNSPLRRTIDKIWAYPI